MASINAVWPEISVKKESFTGSLSDDEIAHILTEEWEKNPVDDELSRDQALYKEMVRIGIRMGTLANGEEYLKSIGAPEKIIKSYNEITVEAAAKAAADQLGLPDHRPLMMQSTRTKEQEKLIADILNREQFNRALRYLYSNYNRASMIVTVGFTEYFGLSKDNASLLMQRDDYEQDLAPTISFLVRYFFALHGRLRTEGVEEIDPVAADNMTDDRREEIRELVVKLASYRHQHGGGFYENIFPCFHLGKSLEPITEITQKDLFGLPLSKIWREQGNIAKHGRVGKLPGYDTEGLPVNVGARTVKGEVVAFAEISDLEGKPIEIDEVCKGVERAVANLIYEAGGPAVLPIRITPQQIYRAYARLPHDANVTEQQAEEMERAMDKLIFAPAQLDYTAQLERHTRVKQQNDFDYDVASGKRKQNLIVATKDEFTLRGQRVVGYKVHEIPILYLYSHGFGQIAWTPNQLLTGPERPAVRETKEKGSQNNARTVAMKENILTRVYRMEQRSKAHKSYTALIRIDEVAEDIFPDGLQGLTERGRRTLRKNMSQYLEFLQAEGKIKGFEETKERREVVGYTVKL